MHSLDRTGVGLKLRRGGRHDNAARGLGADARQQKQGVSQLAAEKDELLSALRKAEDQLERAQLQVLGGSRCRGL